MLKKILVLSLLMVVVAMSGCGGTDTSELADKCVTVDGEQGTWRAGVCDYS